MQYRNFAMLLFVKVDFSSIYHKCGGEAMIKKKAVGYARYSSTNQREESIVRQVESIRDFCEKNNLDLIEEYIDEAQSATTDRRDNFQRMMDDAMFGDWDFIVVYKMDRLSRNVADAMHYKKKLSKVGIRLLSVIEDFDETTPEGGFFNLITLGISEFYVKNLAREAFAGQMQNAKRAMATGGPPPLGYMFNKEKMLIINPEEAEAVKLIFEMFVNGYSYKAIADTLNEKGFKTRYDNFFSASFHDTLKNRKYIGEYVYNLASKKNIDGTRNHHKKKPESEVVRIPGAVPRIIDDKTFEKAQDMMEKRKHDPFIGQIRGKYLLSGLVKCDKCNYRMSGHTNHNGRNKQIRIIYRCKTKKLVQKCDTKPINVKYLDSYVLKQISSLIKQSNLGKFHKLLKNVVEETKVKIENEIKTLDEKIKVYKDEIKQITDRVASAKRTTDKLLTEQMNDYMEQLDQKNIDKLKLKKDLQFLNKIDYKQVDNKLKRLRTNFDKKTSRRKAIFAITNEIIVNNEKVKIILSLSYFVHQDIHHELLYELEEIRDNIAIRFNHEKLTYIFQ
jgi:site-specific DNA recombinase